MKFRIPWYEGTVPSKVRRYEGNIYEGINIMINIGNMMSIRIMKVITRAPLTKHGVVHRNHRKSTPQTRQRRARSRREARHDLGLMLKMDTE